MGNTTFTRLYERVAQDPALTFNERGTLVKLPPKFNHKDDIKLRLRAFAFMVNGEYVWAPGPDPDELLRIGRWIDWAQQIGALKRGFVSSRANGGFAIYFQREDDADTFLMQCLLNDSVFEEGNIIEQALPLHRDGRTQLPGRNSRSLSEPFSKDLLTRLYVLHDSPLDPKSYIVAKLVDDSTPEAKIIWYDGWS